MDVSSKKNTVGAVIIYNPEEGVLANIYSYINEVDALIVIDNSDICTESIQTTLKGISQVIYINNKENLGLAHALNMAAKLAIRKNYKWLLTMDQDSKASSSMFSTMRYNLSLLSKNQKIGIISPVHLDKNNISKEKEAEKLIERCIVMTSGNLLNLEAFKAVGPFEEKLFIDYIDHEYCLRLKMNGFSIYESTNSYLYHNLGNITIHSLLRKSIATTNHSPIRRYYITRNRLYVLKKYKQIYPDYYKKELMHIWKDLARILLLEKNKIKKIKFILLGFYHFRKDIFYKLSV